MASSADEFELLVSFPDQISNRARNFSDAVINQVSKSMSSAPCVDGGDLDASCRDDAAALRLKIVAIAAILVAGVAGVALPLLGRKRRYLRTDSTLFTLAKAFAAGVILATGFVHMLSDGQDALSNPCLPRSPWSQFPFPGFIAMLAALGTLVLDFIATQFYERKHQEQLAAALPSASNAPLLHDDVGIVMENARCPDKEGNEDMHIVGVRAHAAAHNHDNHGHSHSHPHSHAHDGGCDSEVSQQVRHVVVSQILELGIVSHSVIIGLSLGVSRSPCTIRPLIGALSFHQFFEGLALGGCISQAQFGGIAAGLMAGFFAVTTPAGIAAGTGAAALYDPNSPRALAVEGVLDCVSAGILIYMALVDLIAADFLSRRMSCDVRLQVGSYVALFLGAASMSLLAIWA